MIPCYCIDASNKPKEVFIGEWLTEGMKYHITHVFYHPKQGIQGCALREVRLTGKSKPYESYRLSRFAVTEQGYQDLLQMVKDCSELNDMDVLKLIEESEIEVSK